MATTCLWKFKSRLKTLIEYVTNDEKTKNKLYVSGVNCLPSIAYNEMMNTKKQFFKTGGIECFHGYQSFASGEVTPAEAHEIGVKLAEQLWGDKYQVIVSTHLNTDNIHNHFVLNSVSFKDGKRFHNSKKDYNQMRFVSDNLCSEYRLSVVKQKYDYSKYATNNLYKELMKDSIDYAIENAENFEEFISILKELDYDVTIRNNELSIKRDPYKRNTRILRQFGNNYSLENINKRILEEQPLFKHFPQAYLTINTRLDYYNKNKNKLFQNKSILSNLFSKYNKVLILELEKHSKTNTTKYTPELIRALKKLDDYSKQAIFLSKNNINEYEDLLNFEKSVYEKINPLKDEREKLWQKLKRVKDTTKKENIELQIKEISKKLYPLSEDLKYCKQIIDRMDYYKEQEIAERLLAEKELAKNKRHKNRER